MRGFALILGQRRKVLFTGFVIAGLKFGSLTLLLAGTGRLLNISNTFTTRTVGVVALSSCLVWFYLSYVACIDMFVVKLSISRCASLALGSCVGVSEALLLGTWLDLEGSGQVPLWSILLIGVLSP